MCIWLTGLCLFFSSWLIRTVRKTKDKVLEVVGKRWVHMLTAFMPSVCFQMPWCFAFLCYRKCEHHLTLSGSFWIYDKCLLYSRIREAINTINSIISYYVVFITIAFLCFFNQTSSFCRVENTFPIQIKSWNNYFFCKLSLQY